MFGVFMEFGLHSQEMTPQGATVPWWHPQKESSSDASGQNSKASLMTSPKPWWMDETKKPNNSGESWVTKVPEGSFVSKKIDQSLFKAQKVWATPSKPAPKRASRRPAVVAAVQRAEKRSAAPRDELAKFIDEQARTRLTEAIAPQSEVVKTMPAFKGLSLEELSAVEAEWDIAVPIVEPAPFATREQLRERRLKRRKEVLGSSKKKGRKIRRRKTRKNKKIEVAPVADSPVEAVEFLPLPSFDEELLGGPVVLRIEQVEPLENDGESVGEPPLIRRSLQFLHRCLSS